MALTKVLGTGIEDNPTIAGNLTVSGTSTLADNLVFSGSGKGVHLGVTSATAANLLDDYEEGTWTPTLTSSSGASRAVDSQVSRYTKIGRICYVSCQIGTIGALSGSNTGTLRVDGLPFNYNGSVSKSITSDVRFQHVNLPSGIIQTTMIQNSSGTTNEFFFSSTFDDNSAGELGISALSTSSDITFSLVYEVA
jgi:hypothetical protein